MRKIEEGKFPLVLTEPREHAEVLNQLLIDNGLTTVVLRGEMRAKERKEANEQLATVQVLVMPLAPAYIFNCLKLNDKRLFLDNWD